ncbi:MAG TPA: hypothetical protein VGQ83_35705 [Polyangia bacterium]|jgi:hypothetical protein
MRTLRLLVSFRLHRLAVLAAALVAGGALMACQQKPAGKPAPAPAPTAPSGALPTAPTGVPQPATSQPAAPASMGAAPASQKLPGPGDTLRVLVSGPVSMVVSDIDAARASGKPPTFHAVPKAEAPGLLERVGLDQKLGEAREDACAPGLALHLRSERGGSLGLIALCKGVAPGPGSAGVYSPRGRKGPRYPITIMHGAEIAANIKRLLATPAVAPVTPPAK